MAKRSGVYFGHFTLQGLLVPILHINTELFLMMSLFPGKQNLSRLFSEKEENI